MSTQQHLHTLRPMIAKATAIALLMTVFVYMLAPKRAARDPKPEPVGGKNNLHGGQASPIQAFLRSQSTASLFPSQSRATKMLLCRSQEETPSWAIAYGHAFWRHEPTELSTSSLSPAARIALRDLPSFDVNDVIKRISHAFSAGVSGATANMRARTYTASFDGAALHFSPFEPDRNSGTSGGSPGPGIEARFLTTSVRLGENVLYDSDQSVGVSAVLGNTAQILLEPKSGLVEHFETRSEGVAVSWIISQPSGKDPSSEQSAELRPDLVVEAELSGLTYAGRTSGGHHFADADGISRLVFGKARVVDAAGRTWDVPVTVTENRLSLTVPGVILAQSQYPVALDPVIGPEFGVDNPILSPSTIAQVKPAIASNGRTYLVVWATSAGVVENSGAPAIAACRVTQTGVVLDVQGIGIIPRFQTASSQWTMRAASDGSDYLVVWQELRVGGNVITGARVSR